MRDQNKTAKDIPENRRQTILAELNQIQHTASLPVIVPRILEVSSDPDSSARNLGEVIKHDQSLTAKILRIVNSAFYGLYRKVGNINHAIVILGFEEIRNISIAACLIKSFKDTKTKYFNQNEFWNHSLCTAYISKALADLKQNLNKEDAFVTGLLHDYGKVILYQFFNAYFTEIIQIAHKKNVPLQKIEREYLNIDHAEIGGIVCENWRLPVKLVKAVSLHHDPSAAIRNDYDTHLAHISNCLEHKFGIGNSGNPVKEELNAESMQIFGLTGIEDETLWESLNINLNRVQGIISISKS